MFDSKRWVDAVVSRSDLLTEEAVVFGDKELCYREAYPDRGGYLVKEGHQIHLRYILQMTFKALS